MARFTENKPEADRGPRRDAGGPRGRRRPFIRAVSGFPDPAGGAGPYELRPGAVTFANMAYNMKRWRWLDSRSLSA